MINKKMTYGSRQQTIKLPIRCHTDAAVTTLISCTASMGNSDSLWSLQLANGTVEEFVYRYGNVLIGSASSIPQAPFQIDIADTVQWPHNSTSGLYSSMLINGSNKLLVLNNSAMWNDGNCLRVGADNSGHLVQSHKLCAQSSVIASSLEFADATALGSAAISAAGASGFETLVEAEGAVALGAYNVKLLPAATRSVAMGENNVVSSANSYAIGKKISVSHSNAMVLGTMETGTINSSSSHEFTAVFDNGYRFLTNATSAVDQESTVYINGDGNVGIGTQTIGSTKLSIQGRSDYNRAAYIFQPSRNEEDSSYGLVVETATNGSEPTNKFIAIEGKLNVPNGNHAGYYYGVRGVANLPSDNEMGKSIGVYGVAGNAGVHSGGGYNYGVFGNLVGTRNGAGVYGTVTGTMKDLYERYAGYFEGNVKVLGTVDSTSDRNLKKDIAPLKNSLDKLIRINGVSFNWKDKSIGRKGKKEYGVIAQEVEQVFPDIVSTEAKTNGQAIKSVNYMGLIAPIIESIKEISHQLISHFNKHDRRMTQLESENKLLKEQLVQQQLILEKLQEDIAALKPVKPGPL